MCKYNKEYYETGLITGKSLYLNYRWIPELTIPMAYFIIKELDIKKNDRILDFGCAKGFLVKAFRLLDFNAWGIDISDYAINEIDGSIRQYCRVATEITEEYDWIIAKNVFEHISESEINLILENLARYAKRMFAIIPLSKDDQSNKFIITQENKEPTHMLARTQKWWQKKFIDCGFLLKRFDYKFKGCKENYVKEWPKGNGFFQLVSIKTKSDAENKYTSTGSKILYHHDALNSYRQKNGHTVISTHISPEGNCNLNCAYCSVSKRNKHESIPLEIIQKYITDLKTRGLKAVIIGGGGEPTLYPQIKELIKWLKIEQELEVSLITNGTKLENIGIEILNLLTWFRISILIEKPQLTSIDLNKINPEITIGYSLVITKKTIDMLKTFLPHLSIILNSTNGKYFRILPDCLICGNELINLHLQIDKILENTIDKRIFHQWKYHGIPTFNICHQSYFRPFLSETNGGTVFPCDSIALNNAPGKFLDKYALCKPENILDYLDHKIPQKFNPNKDCVGCVFVNNNQLLEYYYRDKTLPEWSGNNTEHINFI